MVTSYLSSVEPHNPPAPVSPDELIRVAREAGCSLHVIAAAHDRVHELRSNYFASMVSDSIEDVELDAYDAARKILLDGAGEAVRAAVDNVDAEHRKAVAARYEIEVEP